MAQNLSEYLAEHKCQGFKSVPHYFPEGDFVSFFFRPERCYAERVDDMLTIYLAMESKDLVGCKIKGIRHVLKTAGNFGVSVADGDLRLGLFFFVRSAMAQSDEQRQRYEQLGHIAKDATLDRRELPPAYGLPRKFCDIAYGCDYGELPTVSHMSTACCVAEHLR